MEDSGELNIVALVKEHLRQSESCGEKSGRLSNMIEFLKRAKSEHEASAIPSLQDGLDELTTQWDKFKTFSEETDKLKIILDKTDGETCEIQGQLAALTRRDEYTKQRDLFNEYSGLQFEVNQDETLALNLTKIDPNDPSGTISVHLCLKDNTATNYQWSCKPVIFV
jgi:hypothetical protein